MDLTRYANDLIEKIKKDGNKTFALYEERIPKLQEDERKHFKTSRYEGCPVLKSALVVFNQEQKIMTFERTPLVPSSMRVQVENLSEIDIKDSVLQDEINEKASQKKDFTFFYQGIEYALLMDKQKNEYQIFKTLPPQITRDIVSHRSILIYGDSIEDARKKVYPLIQEEISGPYGLAYSPVSVRGYYYFFEIFGVVVQGIPSWSVSGKPVHFFNFSDAKKYLSIANRDVTKTMELDILEMMYYVLFPDAPRPEKEIFGKETTALIREISECSQEVHRILQEKGTEEKVLKKAQKVAEIAKKLQEKTEQL